MGWSVRIFDPDPDAKRKIGEVLENARRSLPGLSDKKQPQEGAITFHDKMSDAVNGAVWIQESVPERLELKQKVYQTLQAAAEPDAIIGSSTSGFKPSELQNCASFPEQIVVAHPFNPVYLLPLAELVPSAINPPEIVARAKDILTQIGMYPLEVRQEIDAHIADRFLEAVWREALWMIKDGIATTQEIDDAIRYGFGLRWAQMGLFETYRIAGGEAGMKHFIEQFGPCLAWPWTKLMDVPELTPELVEMIADQSDAQSGHHSIRDLERIRDTNLVTMMRGLKAENWGAGQLLNAHDARQSDTTTDLATTAPILTVERTIPLDWTDYNGHMNEARYLQVFGDGTDRFMELIGCDADYIAKGGSYFTVETHIRHLDEVHAGSQVKVETLCLSGEGKRMHLFHELKRQDGHLLATGEHMLVHVDLTTRASSLPAPAIAETLTAIALGHSDLAPEGAGKAIERRMAK
ncbi:UNVERIFIED_CONTAM: hypothetical protein GTU68_049105 [Idotea baltica]|nr:hypothetical protein [Idotea baltica]